MKLRFWFVLPLVFVVGLISWSEDYVLVPENFFMHKGDSLNVHLFSAELFDRTKEQKYDRASTEKFAIYQDGKRVDVIAHMQDNTAPVLATKLNSSGLAMIEMVKTFQPEDIDKADFVTDLESEGLIKLSEKVNNVGQNRIRTKTTCYLKSLVTVDKPTGGTFTAVLNHTLEISFKQNPYKLNYGDEVTAEIKFKGKPLPNAKVDLLIKTSSGRVYPQKLIGDALGNVSLNVSREGIYLLRMMYVEPSTSKDYDYEKWGAAYSFAFSNNGTMPNTYKEFGLGNSH
ncbi:DUF4198 domain-containing protein [uncultured Mucilaginibacter sp.]|uniref:DUF4198 domain-containing protein n=1 Tax=uncultured Mucilaginibacter sp. TaxID=797541 RepID=UPI0025F536C0|nr:DUF4198 domain-containing protein [uncultured Mucilaginibacter sp.]